MRRSLLLLLAPRSRKLSGLCSACAPQTCAKPARPPASSATRPRSSSTKTALPTSQPACASAIPRRWFSASAPSRAHDRQGTGNAPDAEAQPSPSPARPPPPPKTTAHKPLPYYALFPETLPDGGPPTGAFDIDARALRREFLRLQAAAHPDLHHETPSGRRRADALSSHINAAYRTLASPLARAQYLLAERYGVDLAGDEAAAHTGPPDPALLAEVLAAREEVEDARDEADLAAVAAANEARAEACLRALAAALAAEDVEAAVREAVRLRYWENIRESVRDWEEGKPVVLQH